jgi:catechol 2,3-dioxygenase-like lactoylglutathione lyase family enzyme
VKIVGIDHVQLAIPPGGEAQARAFYAGVLGLVEVPKPEPMRARGGMWFDGGIHLGIEEDMRPSHKMHPALVVDDLEALVAKLVAAGYEWKPSDELPGVQRGHTKDPFGNRIELIASR